MTSIYGPGDRRVQARAVFDANVETVEARKPLSKREQVESARRAPQPADVFSDLGRGDQKQRLAMRLWEERTRLAEQQGSGIPTTSIRDANELHAQKQREWVADKDVPLRGEFFGSVANPDRKTLYSKDVLNAQIEKAQRFLSQPEASTAQTSLLEKKMQEWAADQQYCRTEPFKNLGANHRTSVGRPLMPKQAHDGSNVRFEAPTIGGHHHGMELPNWQASLPPQYRQQYDPLEHYQMPSDAKKALERYQMHYDDAQPKTGMMAHFAI